MNPVSFVKSLTLVGSELEVMKPESFVKSETFVGTELEVIKPLSLVKSLVLLGIVGLLDKSLYEPLKVV